ncbi:MAG: NAD(P)H-dependent oxidoreductase [Pseudomonas sp.]|nr:NAD(P)H-dependent oxidoreductase [Pseudomonas sp.]
MLQPPQQRLPGHAGLIAQQGRHPATERGAGQAGACPAIAADRRAEVGLADHAVHRRLGKPPADVLAEQARIERADTVVMVFPIYWWSLPALLKGWVERVFSNGWAFDQAADGATTKLLHGMTAHLVGVAGADAGTFERHGYGEAMRVQIEHGIFDYCGARVISSTLFTDSEGAAPASLLPQARQLGSTLFEGQEAAA